MTTDPEPLSAGELAALRRDLYADPPPDTYAFTTTEVCRLLATLDEARATPSGDLDLRVRRIVERAANMGSCSQTHHEHLSSDARKVDAALRSVSADSTAGLDVDAMEAEAGRLLVESARLRAARQGPDDAHEMRHLWAAINAGNSDPCGVNGESCHLDVDAIARWTQQYPTVVGYGFDPAPGSLSDTSGDTA